MGCILVKICDPPLPDPAIRDFWHINGVILDGYPPATTSSQLRARPNTRSSSLDVSSAMSNAASRHSSATMAENDFPGEHNEKAQNTGSSNGIASQKQATVQKRPAGVLYVYNGRLVYKSRRCALLSRNTKQLNIEICDVHEVKALGNFTSNKDDKTYSGRVVDVSVTNKGAMHFHIGFFTNQAEEVSRQLAETCLRHRQKPKIFQFNSVDVDGVEIDLP